jgi:hypothetical protein
MMGDAHPAEITLIVDRLELVVDQENEIPAAAIIEIRSVIELVRGGQPCAAVSALLAARGELGRTPRDPTIARPPARGRPAT